MGGRLHPGLHGRGLHDLSMCRRKSTGGGRGGTVFLLPWAVKAQAQSQPVPYLPSVPPSGCQWIRGARGPAGPGSPLSTTSRWIFLTTLVLCS